MKQQVARARVQRAWIVFSVLWCGTFAYQYYSTRQPLENAQAELKKAEAHAPYVALERSVMQQVNTETSSLGIQTPTSEYRGTPWNQVEVLQAEANKLNAKANNSLELLFGGLVGSGLLCFAFLWIVYGRNSLDGAS